MTRIFPLSITQSPAPHPEVRKKIDEAGSSCKEKKFEVFRGAKLSGLRQTAQTTLFQHTHLRQSRTQDYRRKDEDRDLLFLQ